MKSRHRPAYDGDFSPDQVGKMEKEVIDLKILNKGKDFLIEQLREERDGFFNQLLDASRKVGELEPAVSCRIEHLRSLPANRTGLLIFTSSHPPQS